MWLVDILCQKEYSYTYEEGRITRAVESNVALNENQMITAKTIVHTLRCIYDQEGNLLRKHSVTADGTQQISYCENDANDCTMVKVQNGNHGFASHSKTDSFGRKVFDKLQLGTGTVSRQFLYHAGQATEEHADNSKIKSTPTTNLVSQIILSDGHTLKYEYDAEERITKVVDSHYGMTEYTYDALGQLLSKNNRNTISNTMTYDNYGNILTKDGVTYTYGDGVWKDKLTAVGDKTISYDAQGNPTSYLGHTLTWEKGRQLKSFDGNTYTYNANGIRTSKTVNGVKHTYTLDGTKILKETWGDNTLVPLYDNEESVCGILYNGTPYYFLKNLQGDVTAICTRTGAIPADYAYDAWGACSITYSDPNSDIASVNPFRYRSYYYDAETGLYYVSSRYYDPEIGRWLNSDDPAIIDNASDYNILSCNKYCYCLNSPANDSDKNGFFILGIAKMIGNFILGMAGGMFGMYLANVTLNIVNGKKNFYSKNDSWGAYIAEGVKAGAFSIFGSKYLIKLLAVLGASLLKQFVDFLLSKKPFNWKEFLLDLFIGCIAVTLFHFAPTILKKLPKKKRDNSSWIINKLKSMIKKIADYIMKTLKGIIYKLINFFKNFLLNNFLSAMQKRLGLN